MIFSTKGFWCFVFTKNYHDLEYPKDALRNAQEDIAKQVGLTIGEPETSDIDFHIVVSLEQAREAVRVVSMLV